MKRHFTPLIVILIVLALVAVIAGMSTLSGCKIVGKALGYKTKAEKALEEQGFKGPKKPKTCPTCKRLIKPGLVKQVEYKIGAALGLAAYLGGLAIVGGAIILVVAGIKTGKWRLGLGLFGGGVLATLGILATAVMLPWIRKIAVGIMIAVVVLVIAGVVWALYQMIVLKRGFREVVAGFQLAKRRDWETDKTIKNEIEKLYAPETTELVADVKATLPPTEPSTP
jgi:hypothetical protein